MPLSNFRIKLLDTRLANQIAAGEVVERPASVVKELMENSIDAQANRIEVEIERGGTRLIKISDNGKGIHQDDLALSLTRHATSKIETTQDLTAIASLGFRGEALASISAVSKLVLTSRPPDADLAWQAIAHGRDMQVEILPAAASVGTRIEVADLFYNTPARQKFLRAEKTEFNHIDEVFKRHALANFEIAFVLKHNHKVIKQLAAIKDASHNIKRIERVCGKPFAQQCVEFQCQHEQIQLSGWLGLPSYHRSESDIQYVFINGRPVKDKTLNHAIRQAYQGLLPQGRMATYVIYLNMDPTDVDVNVHPTKHEVRFGEQRLIHDLLVKSISDALNEQNVSGQMELAQSDPARPRLAQSHLTHKFDDQIVSEQLANDQHLSAQSQNELAAIDGTLLPNQTAATDYSDVARVVSAPTKSVSRPSNRYQNNYPNPNNLLFRPSGHDHLKVAEASHSTNKALQSNQINPLKINQTIMINQQFWVAQISSKVLLIDTGRLFKCYLQGVLNQQLNPVSQSLLFPQRLMLSVDLLEQAELHQQLSKLGFGFELVAPLNPIKTAEANSTLKNNLQQSGSLKGGLLIKKMPVWIEQKSQSSQLNDIANWLEVFSIDGEALVSKITSEHQLPAAVVEKLCQQESEFVLTSQCWREITAEFALGLFQ